MLTRTQTQTIRKPVINPARHHDYLYDPTLTLSSERDHARNAYKAHTRVEKVKKVVEFQQMFSDLRHYPRFEIRLDPTDPVPQFIDHHWRGRANQNREALIRYTKIHYDPTVKVPGIKYEDPKVTGTNRWKYFAFPLFPFLHHLPPEVFLQTKLDNPLQQPTFDLQQTTTSKWRTVEVQTDYRESAAQTDPYTPEYVVRPGSAPEVLTLATLAYGRGLPAGLVEVEMIERAREKRAWERTLPPLSDSKQHEKRRRMMEEMERKEWAFREQEIEKLQEERLEVLLKLLDERETKRQCLNDKRFQKIWNKGQAVKETNMQNIRNKHVRVIRKLTRQRENVDGKWQRRDIIEEYGVFGSQVHAPLSRIGLFIDRGAEQYVVRSDYISTYRGMLQLEKSLPEYAVQPRIKAPKMRLFRRTSFVSKKERRFVELAEIHEAIKEAKNKGAEPVKPPRYLEKVEKPIFRPSTPSIIIPPPEVDQSELAAILLQKLIRGRAVQNMMFEGKEKRIELIIEIRCTHALQRAEKLIKRDEKHEIVSLQRQRRLHRHATSRVNEVLGELEGEPIADLLDFLSKELIRLQEERRLHALSILAGRRRRIREAEESGRRQVEQRRRREEDEVFKQLVKVHQGTVDTYLEDLVIGSIEGLADYQARQEVRDYADRINDLDYEMEERRTLVQSEEIASELVHNFLLPEILKEKSRKRIKEFQRKHLVAAHRIINATVEPLIEKKEE